MATNNVNKVSIDVPSRTLNQAGIDLIKSFEKCVLKSYRHGNEPWTIGWGNTYYPDCKPVKEGQVITQERADEIFKAILYSDFIEPVNKLITSKVTDNQFAALVSFAYNLGVGSLKKSNLLKLVNADPANPKIAKYTLGADGIAVTRSCEFLGWVSAGSNFEKGLRRRRQAECDLYNKV